MHMCTYIYAYLNLCTLPGIVIDVYVTVDTYISKQARANSLFILIQTALIDSIMKIMKLVEQKYIRCRMHIESRCLPSCV